MPKRRGAVAVGAATLVLAVLAGRCGDDGPETAEDFARRSCAAVVGAADIADDESAEEDRRRQERETADATRAADLDPTWRTLAAVDGLVAECEPFRP